VRRRHACSGDECGFGESVDEGKFRKDLYYRLALITVNLAPLRARMGDIPALESSIVAKHAVREHKGGDAYFARIDRSTLYEHLDRLSVGKGKR